MRRELVHVEANDVKRFQRKQGFLQILEENAASLWRAGAAEKRRIEHIEIERDIDRHVAAERQHDIEHVLDIERMKICVRKGKIPFSALA